MTVELMTEMDKKLLKVRQPYNRVEKKLTETDRKLKLMEKCGDGIFHCYTIKVTDFNQRLSQKFS